MKKVFNLLTLTFICISSALAESGKSVPGYFGARNAASLFVNPNISVGEKLVERLFKPDIGLSFERAVNRRASYTIAVGTNSGYFDENDYFRFFELLNNRIVIDNKELYEIQGKIHYSNKFVSISKSFYSLRSGSIAPQGKYFKLGLKWNFFKITKDDLNYQMYDNVTSWYRNPETDFKTRILGTITSEFGAKRFLTKNIYVQRSIAFNLPLNFWLTGNYSSYENMNDYNESFLGYRLSYMQTFSFNISLGYAF
jgi:hypothetical protein